MYYEWCMFLHFLCEISNLRNQFSFSKFFQTFQNMPLLNSALWNKLKFKNETKDKTEKLHDCMTTFPRLIRVALSLIMRLPSAGRIQQPKNQTRKKWSFDIFIWFWHFQKMSAGSPWWIFLHSFLIIVIMRRNEEWN